MNIKKFLKQLKARQAASKINAEGSRSHAERAIIVRWGRTATLQREPLREREKGEIE